MKLKSNWRYRSHSLRISKTQPRAKAIIHMICSGLVVTSSLLATCSQWIQSLFPVFQIMPVLLPEADKIRPGGQIGRLALLSMPNFTFFKSHWLTAPSTGHNCNEGRISRSIGTNSVQWIHINKVLQIFKGIDYAYICISKWYTGDAWQKYMKNPRMAR